jgi:hypothetical protein
MDHTIEPDASHGLDLERTEPLPFGARLVVCFLAVDALQRAVEVGTYLRQASGALHPPATATAPNLPVLGLWVAVDVLLVLLLLMRTTAGRLFSAAVFVLHAFYLAHILTVSDPTLWLYMSDWGRVRLALTLFLDAAAVVYLLGHEATRALDHG